jgi:hypothetical protein
MLYSKISRVVSLIYARADRDRKDIEDAIRLYRYLIDIPDAKAKKRNT